MKNNAFSKSFINSFLLSMSMRALYLFLLPLGYQRVKKIPWGDHREKKSIIRPPAEYFLMANFTLLGHSRKRF